MPHRPWIHIAFRVAIFYAYCLFGISLVFVFREGPPGTVHQNGPLYPNLYCFYRSTNPELILKAVKITKVLKAST